MTAGGGGWVHRVHSVVRKLEDLGTTCPSFQLLWRAGGALPALQYPSSPSGSFGGQRPPAGPAGPQGSRRAPSPRQELEGWVCSAHPSSYISISMFIIDSLIRLIFQKYMIYLFGDGHTEQEYKTFSLLTVITAIHYSLTYSLSSISLNIITSKIILEKNTSCKKNNNLLKLFKKNQFTHIISQ